MLASENAANERRMNEAVPPRAAALRILATRYGASSANATSHTYSLAAFQQEAVTRALSIMRQRNGVILADSVGLGKTFIAAALIELAVEAKQPCFVVVPAAMRSMWTRELRPLIEQCPQLITIVTHGQLSRGHVVQSKGLVVVDEAHAFRSSQTRRYCALRRSCGRSRVLLLTATPVNNSLSDLYFQLRLFAADNAFRDLGIGSLAALLKSPETDPDALHRLRRAVMIRRTRTELRSRFQQIELPSGEPLRFPREVKLETIAYPFGFSVQEVGSMLERSHFAPYHDEVAPILLRLSLLKRLQSSLPAFATSLDRLIAFYERYISSLAAGRVLRPRMLRDVAAEQLVFTELIADEAPSSLKIEELHDAATADLHTLQSLREMTSRSRDEKLDRLKQLLATRLNRKTVVFTEFIDTAEHLWRVLQRDFRIGLVTGNTAFLGNHVSGRSDVIRRFAPRSNAAPDPPAHEGIDLLIATDVLSEGLNLQDADGVVSYDLPWNPVRLIQRAGRVDRIGSKHDVVHVYNFLPDREFDVLLGLVRALRAKLLQVRQSVGQENVVLEPDELDPDFLAKLRTGGPELLYEDPGDTRFQRELAHLHEAGPIGCVAALAGAQTRVLVCFERGAQFRELVVENGEIFVDPTAADHILEAALKHDEVSDFVSHDCIERAHDHVERDLAAQVGEGRETRVLAREIKSAVQRLGVLIADEVLADADRTLQLLPGFLGNQRSSCLRLRAVTNEALLAAALRDIRLAGTPIAAPEAAEVRLVAAIAAD